MTAPVAATLREPLSVRSSRAVLTWTVRGRAAEGTAWGEALLGEFEETGTPAAAVWWALSSLPVAWRERRKLRRSQLSRRVRITRRVLVSLALLVVGAFALNWLVFGVVYEPSPAMRPTYAVSTRVLIDKVGFRIDGLDRGDVVAVDLPKQYGYSNVLKRVVGLPGDHMACTGAGALTRNGVVVAAPAPADASDAPMCTALTVPPGDVYLLGDNFLDSNDSRVFGPVPSSSIVGRVVAKVWPL